MELINSRLSITSELVKEQPQRTGRPVLSLTHQETQSEIFDEIVFFFFFF